MYTTGTPKNNADLAFRFIIDIRVVAEDTWEEQHPSKQAACTLDSRKGGVFYIHLLFL